jgi:DNA-binding XRE family transcriptional regulator
MALPKSTAVPDSRGVMTKAVVRAAAHLGLSQSALAEVLGLSAATTSRMAGGSYLLTEERKEWELAALLVRLFRALDAVVGSNDAAAQQWLWSENRALGGVPGKLLKNTEGLVRAVHYLDAARGRV